MKAIKLITFRTVLCLMVIVVSLSACAQSQSSGGNQLKPTTAAVQPANTAAPQNTEPAAPAVQATAPEVAATQTQAPAVPTTAPEATEQGQLPDHPGKVVQWVTDVDSSPEAENQTISSGDQYEINIYERPFSKTEMVYRPDLDIYKGQISQDSHFIYVSVFVNQAKLKIDGLKGMYGVELDVDQDGRGDYLVMKSNPDSLDWEKASIIAYIDPDEKVGGKRPILSDAPQVYDGFDQTIFPGSNDPDVAWARVSPKDSNEIDIAFKPSLISDSVQFIWTVWTDDGPKEVKQYDYNDHYTLKEAGSPYKGQAEYPLKDLYQVDNTCRGIYNIISAPKEAQGLCCEPTLPDQPEPGLGAISVLVFADNDANGLHEKNEPGMCKDVTVTMKEGACTESAGKVTTLKLDENCQYNVKDIKLGKYCLAASGATFTTPEQWDIILSDNCTTCNTFKAYFGVQTP